MELQENYDLRLQEQKELLEELFARIFTHQTSIVGGALMREYVDKQKSMKGALLPEIIIQEQAQEYSQHTLAQALLTGTLNAMYEETWERIKEALPDDTNVMMHTIEE